MDRPAIVIRDIHHYGDDLIWLTWVCEVANVRDRFMRGDRVALEHTGDPDTRLRPGDEGTVTRYDPGPGQFSDHRTYHRASELLIRVADMSATVAGHSSNGGPIT